MTEKEEESIASRSVSSSYSDDSSYSSSTRSDNSSSGSGSGSSTTSSEEGVETQTGARRAPTRPAAGDSATSATTAATSTPCSGLRSLQLNPELVFEQPDASWIDIPHGSGSVFRRVVTNYDDFPERRYRVVDYFRTAVEMFVTQVRQEYTHQYLQAKKNDRANIRFIWRNKGELAICFAACCDMLKLLYDRFRPGLERPNWDGIVGQFVLFLMAESRIPAAVLTEQTYKTKFLDWRKGGTRYQGEQLTSNVRFPSAEERRTKIETYLRSGEGYSIESTGVELPSVVRPVPTHVKMADAPVGQEETQNSGALDGSNLASPLVGFSRARAPVKMRSKSHMKPPQAVIAGKQSAEEYRHLHWLAKLTQITGCSPTLEFPAERSYMILAFVRLCETSEMPEQFVTIMNILVRSSLTIQSAFERGGGMVVLRRFVGTLVRLKDACGLINLLEQILRLKLSSWSHSSQQSWLRDLLGNSGNDLRWLRALDIVPPDKQATWSPLITALEQRYVLSNSREEEVRRGAKRARLDNDEALRMSMADNVGVSKLAPYISTAFCVSLPGEFCAPPLSSEMEQDTISFLNKKLRYCEEAQVTWRDAILKALGGSCPGIPIPLWYDPYQLLGVDPYPAN
ncbi:hypothetical protein C3747_7g146 [Trypanosoma cruzi]|uniref:Uncharacterized protein n=2 Tax=Trypanosoma cruzi TaxID=5693 RepID=Q4D5N2_TRYCC|nr:hypothetical protein, conserved [Trypanosoma cruzi]EAN87832.1 hypothetical protein, conserved [Trypanosoma cruzi]PWV20195.1 hypothetical protein C3747_7g146 [Trypanosoma cruzi]RNC60267.1 hypothetical protein TcCL_ESM02054 [Trypanosoma cruzi]|eukprot:XP_809683.1 hypothetical protein [Trypanosoma cruzi strain CL Brener]